MGDDIKEMALQNMIMKKVGTPESILPAVHLFLLKICVVLISASAIANHDVMLQ